jgi:hypothetical protein
LQLADAHLDDQQPERQEREAEEPRRTVAIRGQIADREQERDQEKADEDAVHIDGRLERAEAVDVLAPA